MDPILKPGRNCWRILQTSRTAFLIDGAAFFDAFFHAALRAERSILIAGWDIDSRIRLFPEDQREGFPSVLGDFLRRLVSRKKKLQIHILGWDFAAIYLFQRELFPVFKLPWKRHSRVHFCLDGKHPIGGSQHQKIIVIDDLIAFVGGLDLTKRRWDTPEHKAIDSRRVDPSGRAYHPFHDVQVAVDGKAAEALGELFRIRWKRVKGKEIRPPEKGGSDPWPAVLSPHIQDIHVALSRTEPAYDGRRAIQEVENLYLDSFSSARRFIYIENQYFSSFAVGKAVADILQREQGPEIVIVLRASSEWLEETTMGAFRTRLLARIREADTHGRLMIYYPAILNTDYRYIDVHSKVMIVDDTFVRVGSSNLSNRSMAVDAECDLSFESSGEDRIERRIAQFRNSLLAEHLGVSSGTVSDAFREKGSLIGAIESLRGGNRTLIPFPREEPSWTSELLPDDTIDPVEPIDPEKLLFEFMPEEVTRSAPNTMLRFIILLLGLVGLAAAWQWSALRELINLQNIHAVGEYLDQTDAAPLIVISGYVIGSLIMFPVTVMILATAFFFGPFSGFFYSFIGCLLASVVTYGIGRILGRNLVGRVAGPRMNRISRRLARHGVLVITTARILPVAPFTVVNLVAGASRIRLSEFVLGTIIGIIPGITAATIFEHHLQAVIRNPDIRTLSVLAIIVVLILCGAFMIRSRLSKQEKKDGIGR